MQIKAYGKLLVLAQEFEHAQDVYSLTRGNMINDRTIGNGLDHQLILGNPCIFCFIV